MRIHWTNDVLTPDAIAELLAYTEAMRSHFLPATVSPPDPKFRQALVLHDHAWADRFKGIVLEHLPEARAALRLPEFEVSAIECQGTATLAGGFFKPHKDNQQPHTKARRISWIYYFWSLPKPFSGGELAHDGGMTEPRYNCIAWFDSGQKHQIRPVVGPDGFMNSRFTVNGWVRA